MTRIEQLTNEIPALPVDDRIAIAKEIELSLAVSAELRAEWSRELDRRIERFERGETAAKTADDFLETLEQKHCERMKEPSR